MMVPGKSMTVLGAMLTCCLCGLSASAVAAEDLKLRDGISFYQDVDNGFPIVGENMDDVSVDAERPTFIFFGASGDMNTNRQARRLVALYRKYHDQPVKFVVVDVDHTGLPKVKSLLKTYYKGYIPYEVLLDRNGKPAWSQIGEVDEKIVEKKIEKALP